jgi:hypothetical protein
VAIDPVQVDNREIASDITTISANLLCSQQRRVVACDFAIHVSLARKSPPPQGNATPRLRDPARTPWRKLGINLYRSLREHR